MRRRRYGEWHRSRVLANYARTKSHTAAAAAAGVSAGWAYQVVRSAGLIAEPTPVYTAPLIREAVDLYRTGLSCRAVVAELERRHPDATIPSQETVHQHVKRAGALRTKSRAMELREARRRGKDFDAARAKVLGVVRGRRLSARAIAAELGVSRNVVRRALPAAEKLGPAAATRRRKWDAEIPDVWRRRQLREDVLSRRRRGQTYAQIKLATGLSIATIGAYLRKAGLVKAS